MVAIDVKEAYRSLRSSLGDVCSRRRLVLQPPEGNVTSLKCSHII